MSINPEIVERIRQDIQGAPRGGKTALVARWALVVQRSPQTIWRLLGLNKRQRPAAPRNEAYRAWARVVASVKKRPPEEAGEISTDQAVEIAVSAGLLPPAAAEVPVGTYNRVMAEIGTNKLAVRAARFQARRPNQAHHFDGSSSNFFHVARKLPDGDYVLKMHRPAAGGYKNKPIPVDRLRPIYYGLVDDHSGRRTCDVLAAMGENAPDSLLMLERFWRELGLPARLLADQGLLKKCLATSRWIELVGVELPQMMPYAKRGHGKVENPWRAVWQRFEKPFYAVDDWKAFEISFTEFRQRLKLFNDEMNAKPHRYEKHITRMDAWRRVMPRGGITILPENSLAAAARETPRTVGIDGCFDYNGRRYEVKGLHSAKVNVYESIFDDRLVVQDIETRQRYEVKHFVPLDEGEYKNFDDTPHEIAVKEGAGLSIPETALPYQGPLAPALSREGRGGNVVRMPIKTTVLDVPSVFDVERYASLDEAMEDFDGIVGPVFIPGDQRQAVAAAIEAHGRTRAFVHELGQEIRGGIEMRRAEGL